MRLTVDETHAGLRAKPGRWLLPMALLFGELLPGVRVRPAQPRSIAGVCRGFLARISSLKAGEFRR